MWAQSVLAFTTVVAAQSSTISLSGSHTNIPRWCGKPYQSGSPNFPPGGMLHPPAPSPSPLLFVQLETRFQLYDSSEPKGEFIVEASISRTHGEPFKHKIPEPGSKQKEPFKTLAFDIRIENTDQLLVSNSVNISTGAHVFDFDLSALKPRLKPYQIVLYGTSIHETGSQNYSATSELYYLPAKNTGSTVKVDNLNGGLLVANHVSNYKFEPLLPFGFYTSCSGYLNYSLANVSAYKDLGFTAINPVCALTDGDIGYMFDWLDQENLWFQYDMRGSYLNLSSVAEQIPHIKDRSALLTYYTADEPDGWQYPLDSTEKAYDLLKRTDPYHPTSLVLNCDNYYFKQYSSGADYLMEDAYPVGIDPTYSKKWNTPCNETYGDCGCDDCIGELQDVSMRLDTFFDYQKWLGEWEKPLWAVLQAFSGEQYWSRDPTTDETWAMILLSFNHMAKGIMSWSFPATNTLNKAHAAFAKVATVPPVSKFLLSTQPKALAVKHHKLLDISYWIHRKQIMVGIVNLDYVDSSKKIVVELPVSASRIASQPWGSTSWSVKSTTSGSSLIADGLDGLSTSIIILDIGT